MRRQRLLVAGGWGVLAAVSAIYFALSAVTASNVGKIRSVERNHRGIENALIASVVLAASQSCIFMALSAFVLLGRWCNADTHVGIWFGIISALSLSQMFGLLPASLLCMGYLDEAVLWEKSDVWNISKTLQLRTEGAFGFILAILFFFYGWILLLCKKAFAPEPYRPSLAEAPLYGEHPDAVSTVSA